MPNAIIFNPERFAHYIPDDGKTHRIAISWNRPMGHLYIVVDGEHVATLIRADTLEPLWLEFNE